MIRYLALAICLVLFGVLVGCSGSPLEPPPTEPGGSPDETGLAQQNAEMGGYNRYLWGYWMIRWNPETEQFMKVPLRDASVHLNVRRFLEDSDSICQTCLVIGENDWNEDGDLEVNIGIYHPMKEPYYNDFNSKVFTGFDVRGIAIFPGTKSFPEHGLLASSYDNDEYTIVNADGYTELWSPAAFPPNTIRPLFEYSKGKYANHKAGIPTTLNPFRCYWTLSDRRTFEYADHDWKIFTIRFPAVAVPLEFGYAVDASWARPTNMDDPVVPDDFPFKANSVEAFRIGANIDGQLTPSSGNLQFFLQVYDWQGADTIESVMLEAPDLFNGKEAAEFSEQKPLYTEYVVTSVQNEFNALPGTYPVLACVTDTQSTPIIGKVDAYQIFMVDVVPFIQLEDTVELGECDPVEGAYDTTNATCYFGPVPFAASHQVMGIDSALNPVTGFPNMMATGSIGLCRGTREIFVATETGKDSTDDITVFDIDMKALDYTLDLPPLVTDKGVKPVDLIVNQNVQEVWVSLYNENQIAVFPAGMSAPDVTRVDVGTGPVTLAIDQIAYKVFVACEGNDKVYVVNGWSRAVEHEIPLHSPLQSPDPDFPAAVGMGYVPGSDTLFVATLDEGEVDYYTVSTTNYEGTIALSDGTYAVVGVLYEPSTGLIYATGQTAPPVEYGMVWVIDPETHQVMANIETSGVNPSFPAVDANNKRLFVPDPIGRVDIFQITS